MDYISPDRSLEGACGDPGPLFGDHDGSLLDHMGFHGDPQHVSPQLNEGLLVDPTDQISYLGADSLPFMNDQIPCNTMKSASTSPASPLKQADDHHVHIDSDMENDAAEQNLHNSYSEEQATSLGYNTNRATAVVDAEQATELHESSGNNASNFQEETTHCDTYLGDAMLNENSSRDYQLNNSGVDDDEIPNSSALQMENMDSRGLHETSRSEKYESEDDQMNGRNSSPSDERDENCNSVIEPSYLEAMDKENPGSKNGILTPSNQWDSPPESSARHEKGTPSPDRMVSLPAERSHTHSPKELESPRVENDVGKFASPQNSPARRRSRSLEKHDSNHRRTSSRELSPHVRQNSPSPPEKKARREHRHGDGSPRRRSVSPRRGLPKRRDSPRRDSPSRRRDSPRRKDSPSRRRDSPRRDSPSRRRDSPSRRRDSPRRASPSRRRDSPRRDSPSRRRDSPRRDSPSRRRDSPRRASPSRRRDSPRRDSPSRRRDSPRRRHRSKSRSPSRKTDGSRHRREHGRSRSRSPHSRSHHRRSPRRHSPRRRSSPSSHRHHSPRRPWSPPANRKTGLGKPGRNLFVAGFSYATTERDLEKKFSKYGRVTSARVVRDKRSGDSRGFGFLSLEKDEDADAAIRACDETEWNGRIILVEKSKAPTW
ncbi:serine/arginine repetitive matrix protein 5-like [Oryza brachyantha]|uniref:serine/arginine repetitive matrix protein 5-like n=1 Tax=Oryza brachyantha TaxID=4533 RepID=UPI001ADC3EEA|nr:serine/arginine repetitive matrix protein 5-like [Oryza brachyantha]